MSEHKAQIQTAITNFSSGHTLDNARTLLNTLGYDSDRTLQLSPNNFNGFSEQFNTNESNFNPEKAKKDDWQSIDIVFQITEDDIRKTQSLFQARQVDNTIIESYLFFALSLTGDKYTRGDLVRITREINRLTPMPSMILFSYNNYLTIAVIDRRLHKAVLQNLFFATLNTEMNKDKPGSRKFRGKGKTGGRDQHYMIHNVFRYEDYFTNPQDTLEEYFEDMPFLNGGLFECLDKEIEVSPTLEKGGKGGFSGKKIIRIDGFSDRSDNPLKVPDHLFFSSEQIIDLNEVYGTKNKTYKVKGLIDILDSYKFTVDENTPIEEEIALDPELLGKVFENLLASYNPETQTTARKQTGSFYTPREIVNYMVDESLIACLLNALGSDSRHSRESGNPEAKELDARLRTSGMTDDKEQTLRHLFSYTDDPHQFAHSEVAPLIDAIDDAKILDPACGLGAFPMGVLHKLVYILGKLDPDNSKWRKRQRQKAIKETEETYKIGNKEEHAKLLLDINEVFENNASNYGRKLYLIENCIYGVDIQPIAVQIAKLRFFISLIVDQRIDQSKENLGIRPLPNLETKFVAANMLIGIEKPAQMLLRNPEIDKKEEELRKVRERHFTARTLKTKRECREKDEHLRAEISELLKKDGFPRETTERLAAWNPYDQNASADFFDPEWMFGITDGFDVVIGNPPYVKEYTFREAFDSIRESPYYQGKMDIWYLFACLALDMLGKDTGILTFIATNNWVTNAGASKFRNKLGEDGRIEGILNKIAIKANFKLDGNTEVAQGIVPPQDYVNKASKKVLGNIVNIGDGIFNLSEAEKTKLGFTKKELDLIKPFYTTEELHKYYGDPGNKAWIIYTDSSFKYPQNITPYPNIKKHLDRFQAVITSDNKPYGLHRSRDEYFFKGEKIISLRKCKEPTFTYTDFDCYANYTTSPLKKLRLWRGEDKMKTRYIEIPATGRKKEVIK